MDGGTPATAQPETTNPMNTKHRNLRRIATTLACTSVMTGAMLAQPAPAHASSTLLVSVGVSILESVLSYGVGTGLDALLGVEGDPVGLSADSFEQIEDLVGNAISTAFFNDYQANAETAVDLAQIYICNPASLDICWTHAWNVHEAALESTNEMASVGLQGTATFSLMSSLQLAFLEEMYEITTAMGDDVYADSYREDVTAFAQDHVDHLESMWDEWTDLNNTLYPIYWRDSGEYYDGWIHHKEERACVDDAEGVEHCSPTEYECTCGWWQNCGVMEPGWSCESGDEELSWAKQERNSLRSSTRDVVLGDDFDQFLDDMAHYSTGMWSAGTASEGFCTQYDGRAVRLQSAWGAFATEMNDLFIPHPLAFSDNLLTVECLDDGTIMFETFEGRYLARSLGARIESLSDPSVAQWTPEAQADGTWAFRAPNGKYLRISNEVDYVTSVNGLTVTAGDGQRFDFEEGGGTWASCGYTSNIPIEIGGTLYNGASWSSDAPVMHGLNETSLSLDGVDDYMETDFGGALDFGPDDDFTVAVWIKANATQVYPTGSSNMVVEKWSGGGGYPFVIRYLNQNNANAGKIKVARYDGSAQSVLVSTTSIDDGRFHHVTFVKSGETLSLYIDGQLDGTTADSTTGNTTNNSSLYVGRRGGANPYSFKGNVDDLRIYQGSVSEEEIEFLAGL